MHAHPHCTHSKITLVVGCGHPVPVLTEEEITKSSDICGDDRADLHARDSSALVSSPGPNTQQRMDYITATRVW